MSSERKSTLANIMRLAWQFVKRNGFTMAEALKVAVSYTHLTLPTIEP